MNVDTKELSLSMNIKDSRKKFPIIVDGEEKAVAIWNPEDPRFARWCENMMKIYAGAAKLQNISFPNDWQTEFEVADEDRKSEIINEVQMPFAQTADLIDQLEMAVDNICGKGIADILFTYGGFEHLQNLIGLIWADHTKERKKKIGKYQTKPD